VAGDSANVRACPRPRCRRVTGHTRTSPRPALHARSAGPGGVTTPREHVLVGTTPQQDHPLPLRGVPRRWHRRCPADRHRQRWSDDRRIPPPGAPCTAVLGDPRPAPDAFSAGTRRLGRGCSRRTAPPHHFVVCSVAASCRCPRRCGYHQTFAAGSAGLDDPCDDWQEPADAAYGELRRPSGLAPAVRQGAVNLYASADDRRAGNEGICG
jgi:hypothetical protein